MRVILTTATIALAGLGLGCQKTKSLETSSSVSLSAKDPHTAVMTVHGMACPQCAYNVDLQLNKVAGVEQIKVDLGTGSVYAKLSPTNPPTRQQLEEAIKQTGFTLKHIQMPRSQ